MTVAQLSDKIAAYIDRAGAALVTSGSSQDLILAAINDARRQAQRDHDFKLLEGSAFITTDAAGTNYMTGAKTTPGGETAQKMKKISGVWNYSVSGSYYLRTSRVDFGSIHDHSRNLPLQSSGDETYATNNNSVPNFVYLNGPLLCANGATTATTYMIDGIKWMDDLVAETSDVFVDYFADWIMWSSLLSLNNFLKDDQRMTISAQLLSRAWDSVRELDGSIANSGDWTSLN
jgi:hypothetical protein